jgi:predicted aspartyl protease
VNKPWCLRAAALVGFLSALCAASVDSTLATARKALLNDGVATAWKLGQQALADDPDSPAAHELVGEVLFRRGAFAEAESEFQKATKIDPHFALAWWGLARVAECTSRYKTAAQDIQRAHELDPKDPRIFRDWAMRLHGQPHIDALEKYLAMLDPSRQAQEVETIRNHMQLDRALPSRKLNLLATPYAKAEIPLVALTSPSRSRYFGLFVILNDVPLHLVVDTGANGFVIPLRVAEKAGVARLAPGFLSGIGSNAKLSGGYRGIASRVRIGSLEFHDAVIDVSNQESIGAADGLIGSDVFAQFLVTLDFKARKLRLQPLPGSHPAGRSSSSSSDDELQDPVPAPELRTYSPVFRFGHILLLPTSVSGSRQVLFVIDTGADSSLISYEMAEEVSKISRDDRNGITGINGRVADIYKTGNLAVEFAGFRQKNLGMTSFDMWEQSRRIGTEISGFLGLPALDLFTLTIDYRDGLVNFDRQDP